MEGGSGREPGIRMVGESDAAGIATAVGSSVPSPPYPPGSDAAAGSAAAGMPVVGSSGSLDVAMGSGRSGVDAPGVITDVGSSPPSRDGAAGSSGADAPGVITDVGSSPSSRDGL